MTENGWKVSKRDGHGEATEWTYADCARIHRERRKGRGRFGLGAGVRYVLTTEHETYAALTLEDAQRAWKGETR